MRPQIRSQNLVRGRWSRAAWALALGLLSVQAAQAQALGGTVQEVPDPVWTFMQGRSWQGRIACGGKICACPDRAQLRLVTVPYRDFQGQPRLGQLVVARPAAEGVRAAFEAVFAQGTFRIARMELIDRYYTDPLPPHLRAQHGAARCIDLPPERQGICSDDASMAHNNTSAFNCRATDTGGLSAHGRGAAIDINPIQNPYVRGSLTEPPEGRGCDRPGDRRPGNPACEPGLIAPGDAVTTALRQQGWNWGGTFRTAKDYQHFSYGRR